MPFVLDASVTLCWCFHDERAHLADLVGEMLARRDRALVPMIWWFEIRNATATGLRQKRLSNEHATAFLERIGVARIDITALPDERAVFNLAHRHRLTFYDAAYLELAQRENIALARAATAEGVPLIGAL